MSDETQQPTVIVGTMSIGRTGIEIDMPYDPTFAVVCDRGRRHSPRASHVRGQSLICQRGFSSLLTGPDAIARR